MEFRVNLRVNPVTLDLIQIETQDWVRSPNQGRY